MQPLVQTRSPLDWSPPRPFHCETIPPRNEPTEMLPSRSPDFFFHEQFQSHLMVGYHRFMHPPTGRVPSSTHRLEEIRRTNI